MFRVDARHSRFLQPIVVDCGGLLKMSERDLLFRWLGDAARRIRLNERLEDASRVFIGLLLLVIVHQALIAFIGLRQVSSALFPFFILAAAGIILLFAWRMFGRDMLLPPDRARAAAVADARAALNNELSSALWFVTRASSDHFIELHVARAAQTVQRLDLPHLLPVVAPRHARLAVVLAVIAGLLLWASPHIAFSPESVDSAHPLAQRGAGLVSPQEPGNDEDFEQGEFAGERTETAWLKVENLARELRAGPDTAEIAQAIAARDARTASRLLASIGRREAAQPATGVAAKRDAEQMSEELAKGIVDRLQSLLSEGGGWSPQAGAEDGDDAPGRLTDQLTRELREEMDEAPASRPGEMSPEEQTLNTTLQAMSRDSTGGREVIRGEANPMQGVGRTSVGSGAMGRRVGVSTGGAGDGEQPRGNPDGNAEAESVIGRKTMRLQLQMQTVKIDQPETENVDGSEESFYAATQAQAAKMQYQDIVAEQRGGVEQNTNGEQLPLAYREAVKEYTVRQHRRESVPEQ